eukprot:2960668-Rhodomonas_salina.1
MHWHCVRVTQGEQLATNSASESLPRTVQCVIILKPECFSDYALCRAGGSRGLPASAPHYRADADLLEALE